MANGGPCVPSQGPPLPAQEEQHHAAPHEEAQLAFHVL